MVYCWGAKGVVEVAAVLLTWELMPYYAIYPTCAGSVQAKVLYCATMWTTMLLGATNPMFSTTYA